MNDLIIPTKDLPVLSDVEVKESVDKIGAYVNALSASKKAVTEQAILDEIDSQIRKYSALLIRYRMELGRRTAAIETNITGRGDKVVRTSDDFKPTKTEALAELGISRQRASENERLSANEEEVERYLAEAEEEKRQPTVSGALKAAKEEKSKPHVVNNSGNNEWYTPSEYIESARAVMGSIDLDPASNELANQTVKATRFYDIETNGLLHDWNGNIWMNPPYSSDLIERFADKLVEQIRADNVLSAIVLVNNATETRWFGKLASFANAVVFPQGRIRYDSPEGKKGTPLQGQAFIYFGNDCNCFLQEFEQYGWGAVL